MSVRPSVGRVVGHTRVESRINAFFEQNKGEGMKCKSMTIGTKFKSYMYTSKSTTVGTRGHGFGSLFTGHRSLLRAASVTVASSIQFILILRKRVSMRGANALDEVKTE